MKLVRRLIYFSAAFVFGVGVLLAFFYQMGLFEVSRIPIEIVGASEDSKTRGASATESGLRQRLGAVTRKFEKKRIWEIDLGEVRTSIVRDEWVKDVLIWRSLPNEIKIRIRPKTPVVMLVSERGEFYPITEDGSLLSVVSIDRLPDVPVLRGAEFFEGQSERVRAVNFVMSLPDEGALNRRNISEVGWTKDAGYSLTLIQPKVEVKLGEEQIELKVMRVNQVLNYLSIHQLRGRVIDASFSKKVLVRLRKAP